MDKIESPMAEVLAKYAGINGAAQNRLKTFKIWMTQQPYKVACHIQDFLQTVAVDIVSQAVMDSARDEKDIKDIIADLQAKISVTAGDDSTSQIRAHLIIEYARATADLTRQTRGGRNVKA